MILPFVQRVPSSSEVFYFCTFCHEHTLQLVCFSLFHERLIIIIIIISCDQFLFKYYIKLVTNVLRPNTQAWDCRNSQLVLSMFLFRFDTVGVFSYDQLSSINIANAAYTLFFLHFPGVPYKAVETDRT